MKRSIGSEEVIVVDADWYEDPLDRFDGRFFDGERWTARVADAGSEAIDPDFPPGAVKVAPAVVPIESSATRQPSARQASARQASTMQESPVRTVAVLDENIAGRRVGAPAPRSSRAPLIWALLGLIAALIVAALVLLGSNEDAPDAVVVPVELDSEEEARVEDLESGGAGVEESQADGGLDDGEATELDVDAPVGAVDPGTSFDQSEAIEVGGLRIVNGAPVLADLRAWHRDFAAARGITLDPAASCWFGQLGGAAVQVAHCGPVGGSSASEFVFDSVPLAFEDTDGGQIAQPVVDAAMIDVVLANALTLVGTDDPPVD